MSMVIHSTTQIYDVLQMDSPLVSLRNASYRTRLHRCSLWKV